MNTSDSLHRPLLSIVVPCFNEEESLLALHERLSQAAKRMERDSYEIVWVNDGSTDGSLALMRKLATKDPHLVIVNLSRNYGHQTALSAGLSIARGERVLILDADLQDPPELLPELMAALDQGADVAYGQRIRRNGEGWFKRATASMFYRLLGRLADTTIPCDTGDFRLMSRRAVDILNQMPERSRFIRGMVSWIGLTQVPVPYERHPRQAGKTKYPLRRMLRFALDGITSFSIIPMRIASYVGAALGLVGLALLLYVMRAWLAGETVQGWTSLMVVVLVIGSVQLLCLGVFGEYLGRLYMEAKQRPLFIIESITRSEP